MMFYGWKLFILFEGFGEETPLVLYAWVSDESLDEDTLESNRKKREQLVLDKREEKNK